MTGYLDDILRQSRDSLYRVQEVERLNHGGAWDSRRDSGNPATTQFDFRIDANFF